MVIDTTNWQLVRCRGEKVVVMAPSSIMTKEQALVHAAWLVVMAMANMDEFGRYLEAVQNT